MPRSVDEILGIAYERMAAQSGYAQQLRDIDDLYYGRVDVGIPELQTRDKRAGVANLAMQGIDQHGMRIASVLPDQHWPPLRNSGASENRANKRRQAMFGLWEENDLEVLMHLRARHLIAYAASPIHLRAKKLKPGDPRYRPDNRWTVEWVMRTPHETFPAGGIRPGVVNPADCVFRYHQRYGTLSRLYPEAAALVGRYRNPMPANVGGKVRPDTEIELIEYVDDAECALIATGSNDRPVDLPREASYGLAKITWLDSPGSRTGKFWGIELDRYPLAGDVCPIVIPGRLTLGEAMGQFDQMMGLFVQAAHLMGLELNAVLRSVYPPVYVEDSDPMQPATVEVADPARGKIGKVHGGKLNVIQLSPGFQTYQTIDRLTEAQRQTGLVPAEFGSYSPTNIRTGARGRDVMANTVDFSIQEAQLLFKVALKREDEIAAELAKAYFRGEQKRYAVSWRGAKGTVDYRPEEVFEDGATHSVEYAAVGSDANVLDVRLAQANGTGAMSLATYRRSSPLILDPEFEERQVPIERLEQAQMAGIEQLAAAGQMPPADVSRIIELMYGGTRQWEAVQQVHEEAQQRQAPAVDPVAPGAPEAQPGLAVPGAGAEAGISGPQEGIPPLSALINQLHDTARPAIQGAA